MKLTTKAVKIIILLISLAALLAGVLLVRQLQETRKGAYFGQAKAWFLPTADADTVTSKKVGDRLPVYLVANLGEIKLVAFTMKIVFSPNVLTLEEDDISLNSHFNQPILKHVDSDAGVIILSATVDINDEGVSGSLDTNDPLVKLNFTIKNYGSAEIYLDKNYPYHEFVANTDSDDAKINLRNQNDGNEIKVSYQLVGEECQNGTCVSLTPTEEPEAGTPILNFKVTFTGVLNAQAVKEIPEVVVKIKQGFDLIAEYTGIELEPDEGPVFKGQVFLDGVQPGDGYTIYIKGPKHLARKFCQDKQAERCFGEGQISLQLGENNFDFTQLSLEPGDVPNPLTNMEQDGLVNSNDFSTIRSRLGKTDPEELKVADLDFNGTINTRDLILLLQTLSSKYGEEE